MTKKEKEMIMKVAVETAVKEQVIRCKNYANGIRCSEDPEYMFHYGSQDAIMELMKELGGFTMDDVLQIRDDIATAVKYRLNTDGYLYNGDSCVKIGA